MFGIAIIVIVQKGLLVTVTFNMLRTFLAEISKIYSMKYLLFMFEIAIVSSESSISNSISRQ